MMALAGPPEAGVFVNGRPDLAAALHASGVQLAAGDLSPADARRVYPRGWIGRSVHTLGEADAAVREGADFLLVGSVYPTTTHPGRAPAGLELVRSAVALGRPVIAIGGIDARRAGEVHAAGGYGVAAISALWGAHDPAAAALALLSPWLEDA
jgi:thiamine-phosphate diphosphorylase